jgi:hypothetical protein
MIWTCHTKKIEADISKTKGTIIKMVAVYLHLDSEFKIFLCSLVHPEKLILTLGMKHKFILSENSGEPLNLFVSFSLCVELGIELRDSHLLALTLNPGPQPFCFIFQIGSLAFPSADNDPMSPLSE